MAGLKRIAKLYGRIQLGDVMHVYDYVTDECVPESEMPVGSERWKASERKRWGEIKADIDAEKDNSV